MCELWTKITNFWKTGYKMWENSLEYAFQCLSFLFPLRLWPGSLCTLSCQIFWLVAVPDKELRIDKQITPTIHCFIRMQSYGVIGVAQQVRAHLRKLVNRVWFQLMKADLKRCQPAFWHRPLSFILMPQLGLSSIHPDTHAAILGWKHWALQAAESCLEAEIYVNLQL